MPAKTLVTTALRAISTARTVARYNMKWPVVTIPVSNLATLSLAEKHIPKSSSSYSIAALASLLALGYVATEVELSDEKKESKIDARMGIGPAAASTFINCPVTINYIEALKKMPQLLSSSPLSDYYVERLKLQKKIEECFAAKSAASQIVLVGLGGVGKTQLAAHYYDNAKGYTEKQWFNAESIETLKSQYLVYAQTKHLYELGMTPEATTAVVIQYLNAHQGYLVVYDNADRYEELKLLLPKSGHLLITSRTPTWPKPAELKVDELSEVEARSLIRKISGNTESDTELDSLSQELGHLALALAQASAYLAKRKLSIAEYLKRFRQQEKELLADTSMPSGDKHDPVAITWKMNFEAARTDCAESALILEACSYVGSANIPADLLKAFLSTKKKISSNELDICYEKAVGALSQYSLIQEDKDRKIISVHRLVQKVTRYDIPVEEQVKLLKSWLEIFLSFLAKDDYEVIAKQSVLFTHFDTLLSHLNALKQDDFLFAEALSRGGFIHVKIRATENLLRAIDYFNQSLEIYKKHLGEEHPDVAATLNNLGLAYWRLGGEAQVKRAIAYYEEALKLRKKLLGEEHPDVAATLNNLGAAYWSLGGEAEAQVKQAIVYLEEALKLRKKLLGEEHRDVAQTLNNLGNAYCSLGGEAQVKRAIAYYEEALKLVKKLLGEEHPNVAGTLNNLGTAYSDLGGEASLKRAIAYYEEALKLKKKSLGEEHPDVATTLNNLGVVYWRLAGEAHVKRAISYYEEALKLRKKLLGEEHPDVAQTLNNFGLAHFKLEGEGNVLKAIDFYQQALVMQQKLLQSEHPNLLFTQFNLCLAYFSLKLLDEKAEKDTLEAYDALKKQLRTDHYYAQLAQTLLKSVQEQKECKLGAIEFKFREAGSVTQAARLASGLFVSAKSHSDSSSKAVTPMEVPSAKELK